MINCIIVSKAKGKKLTMLTIDNTIANIGIVSKKNFDNCSIIVSTSNQ